MSPSDSGHAGTVVGSLEVREWDEFSGRESRVMNGKFGRDVTGGKRTEAIRQQGLCKVVLRAEFGAKPEPTTTALFEQIRLAPAKI